MQKENKPIYLVVTPFFPSEKSFRGPFIYDQVQAIANNSTMEVVVFMPSRSVEKQDKYEYGGIEVYLFKIRETPSYFFNGIFNKRNARSFLARIKQCGIDVTNIVAVHCHTAPFGIYGLALKNENPYIKVLLQHHDRDPYTIRNGKMANWKPNLHYRARNTMRIIGAVDYNISISHAVEDNLLAFPKAGEYESFRPYLNRLKGIKKMPSVSVKKSLVLYNGVDLQKFYPKPSLRNYDKFRIGCIGNFQPLKGHITLLMAVKELTDIHPTIPLSVIIIGTGETLNDCKRYVERNRLDNIVEFRTEVDHNALVDFYNSLDLFVLPTTFEGFGCVLTEAYACGVPFMVCEHQGAAECIEPSEINRWTFPAGDYHKLAILIKDFLKNRYQQHLCVPIDINILISDFLRKIDL